MVRNLIPWKRKTEAAAPVRVESDDPFAVLHRQMNELFDDFFRGVGGGLDRWGARWGVPSAGPAEDPRFEVTETDDEIRVKAELPGMEEKDIEVVLDADVLTIRGEKREEREDKKRNRVVSEVRYGQFQRVLPLPAEVDRDRAEARFKRGVLTLVLPKAAEPGARRRTIPIASSD